MIEIKTRDIVSKTQIDFRKSMGTRKAICGDWEWCVRGVLKIVTMCMPVNRFLLGFWLSKLG